MKPKWWVLREEAGELGDAGGGAASAPESAEVPAAESDDTGVNWTGLDEDFDTLDVEGDMEVLGDPSPESAETPAVATPTPAPVPPAAPVPSQQQAAVPPSPSSSPAPAQVAPPPQSQVAPPTATAPQPEVYQAWRNSRVSELEKHYTFSEEDSAALLTEPELVLPKLAARVHMEVLENSMRAMQVMVPLMMEQVQQHTAVETTAKSLFTTINPDLADPRLEPAILQLGAAYRQMNRTAGPEEASRAIGNLVRAALNMPAPQVSPPQGGAGTAPNARPAPAPFAPVRGGGGAGRPVTSQNQFEQLASELLSEDDGYNF